MKIFLVLVVGAVFLGDDHKKNLILSIWISINIRYPAADGEKLQDYKA